jgi:hypothetical protein
MLLLPTLTKTEPSKQPLVLGDTHWIIGLHLNEKIIYKDMPSQARMNAAGALLVSSSVTLLR